MTLIDVYNKLRQLNLPVLQTQDIAAYLNISINHANKILSRIADAKQIIHIRRGMWVFPDVEPLILPGLLTFPSPAYVSLQTALYIHGMISQIPSIIYAVSVARTRTYETSIANISVHHIQPSFFFGYEEMHNDELLKVASPEKALIDIFYLSQTKTRLFSSLPEVELPRKFSMTKANKIIDQISSGRRKTVVQQKFSNFIQKHKSAP
ncbi:MAG: hypothetical protein V4501_08415 [Pseudomonadota bacterium]